MPKKKPVINITKAIYAEAWWENQNGYRRKNKPTKPTVFGYIEVSKTDKHDYAFPYYRDYPNETKFERGVRLGVIDRWTMHVRFIFNAQKRVERSGVKAIAMWKAWNAHIFNGY